MKERELNMLANFMDDLPSDRLHMPQFADPSDSTKTHCGSAGCAAGWAVSLFHREGFTLTTPDFIPVFEGKHGSWGFAWFFDIPICEAGSIVYSGGSSHIPDYLEEFGVSFEDVTPRMVAKRIRDVIRVLGGTVQEDVPVASPLGVVAKREVTRDL